MDRKYEMVYILNPTLSDEELAAVTERIKTNVENTSATIDNVDDWGRKRLAYEIDDQKEGNYTVMSFSADAEAPKEIERLMKITDGVMRFLIVRQPA
ncbi:30S ribosomal protein S6 [Oscillospiraceae bacterium HV4-5-C5C]|nr:30S ribosomal protein S6 [Oscillospiraceae bacterium HV4-5-C5C]